MKKERLFKILFAIIMIVAIYFAIQDNQEKQLAKENNYLSRIVELINNKEYVKVFSLEADTNLSKENKETEKALKQYAGALNAKKFNKISDVEQYLDNIPDNYNGVLSEKINDLKQEIKLIKEKEEAEKKAKIEAKKQQEKAIAEKERANADFTRPLSNYNYFSDYLTSTSYTLMYEEEGMTYMYDTFGNGTNKRAIILNEYDLIDLDMGDITTAELRSMSMEARNYKFGNILHLIYFDGGTTFVMICNLNTYSITCYFKTSEGYGEGSTFNLIDIRS